MRDLAAAYGAIALLLGTLVFLCIRRDGWRTWGGPLALAVAYIGLLLSMTRTLGQPVPSYAMLDAPAEKVNVLWFGFAEGRAIFLISDNATPRCSPLEPCYIKLPWSERQAEALVEAQEEAKKTGGGVKIKKLPGQPFEPSLEERDPLAYSEPQPAPPAKDEQQ